MLLAFASAYPARKGHDLPDVGYARQVSEEPVKAKSEAAVRHAAPTAQVDVPLQAAYILS